MKPDFQTGLRTPLPRRLSLMEARVLAMSLLARDLLPERVIAEVGFAFADHPLISMAEAEQQARLCWRLMEPVTAHRTAPGGI